MVLIYAAQLIGCGGFVSSSLHVSGMLALHSLALALASERLPAFNLQTEGGRNQPVVACDG